MPRNVGTISATREEEAEHRWDLDRMRASRSGVNAAETSLPVADWTPCQDFDTSGAVGTS